MKPELLAAGVGKVWSWEITKLRGPARGVYFELYVVIDIYSRFVVAWRVEAREDARLAQEMLAQAMGVHGVPDVVHADRGTSMTSKPMAQLLVDLGVTRSHSRPRVSDDNPYSEAQFKTSKYAPAFPARFATLHDPREFCAVFFDHCNYVHRHCGIGLHTPASVHHGTAGQVQAARQVTLDGAYAAHPERFGSRRPHPPGLPTSAWINQPSREAQIQSAWTVRVSPSLTASAAPRRPSERPPPSAPGVLRATASRATQPVPWPNPGAARPDPDVVMTPGPHPLLRGLLTSTGGTASRRRAVPGSPSGRWSLGAARLRSQ